jgi:hypothetical protein
MVNVWRPLLIIELRPGEGARSAELAAPECG